MDTSSELLALEVEPFGVRTTVVNSRFFRTELLTKESTNDAEPSIGSSRALAISMADGGRRRPSMQRGAAQRLMLVHGDRVPGQGSQHLGRP